MRNKQKSLSVNRGVIISKFDDKIEQLFHRMDNPPNSITKEEHDAKIEAWHMETYGNLNHMVGKLTKDSSGNIIKVN